MNLLPAYTTPAALAAHLGVSERTVRERARAIGACRIIGRTMLLFPDDVARLMEAFRPCLSRSTSAAQSGTTTSRLSVGEYEALQALRTKPARSGSRRKPKPASGSVISMDRGRM